MAVKSKKKRKLSSARKKAERHSSGFERTLNHTPDGIQYFKLNQGGKKRIEILPFTATADNKYADKGELHFETTFYCHRIGADSLPYVCPKRTRGERCPVCEESSRIYNDPDGDEELAKSLRAKERQLLYVLDHDDMDKGVQIWDMSYFLFGKQLDEKINLSDEEDGYDQFFDPDNGLTVKLGVVEDSFAGNKFYKVAAIDFAKRKEAIDADLWEDLPSLDSLLKVHTYDELKAIMNMEEPEPEDDELEEEAAEMDEAFEEVVGVVGDSESDSKEEDDDDWDDEEWDD